MPKKKPQIIAHRGSASLAPENTRSAIRLALKEDVDWVEIDIRLTRDQQWVVMHDSNLRRVAGKRTSVSKLSLEEIKKVDVGAWFNARFKGERVLTLREACRLILPKARLILDIKSRAKREQIAATLKAQLAGFKAESIVLSSFSLPLLKDLREHLPNCHYGYLIKDRPKSRIRQAVEAGFFSVHPKYSIFTKALAAQAHFSKLQVYIWTVNTQDAMSRVVKNGADGFFTDFPQRASKLF